MRTCDSWFSFEGRCLLCGGKHGSDGTHRGELTHLQMHIRQGYLNDELEQIKPHPVGFPGPPLGEDPDESAWAAWNEEVKKGLKKREACSNPPSTVS